MVRHRPFRSPAPDRARIRPPGPVHRLLSLPRYPACRYAISWERVLKQHELGERGSGRARLLLCTDTPILFREVRGVLDGSFKVDVAETRWAADAALSPLPDVLVVDENLPGGSGAKVAERARALPGGDRLVIFLVGSSESASVAGALDSGVADGGISGPVSAGEFLSRFWRCLKAVDDRRIQALVPEASAMLASGHALFSALESRDLAGNEPTSLDADTRQAVVRAAADLVEMAEGPRLAETLDLLRGHHSSTFAHSLRVGLMMVSFGRAIGVPAADLQVMAKTGLLHDVGKLRVPVRVLAKPGPLDAEERRLIETHPAAGEAMLVSAFGDQKNLLGAVRSHHEKLDGTGYPDGLRGGQIDYLALCTAVVDVFTAITDHRDYRPAVPRETALEWMQGMSGGHLEPKLFARFRELVADTGVGSRDAA